MAAWVSCCVVEDKPRRQIQPKINGRCPGLHSISLNIVEMSLKVARTHSKMSQEETNSRSDLLYQFDYSIYSITQLNKKETEMRKSIIAISS